MQRLMGKHSRHSSRELTQPKHRWITRKKWKSFNQLAQSWKKWKSVNQFAQSWN